MRGAIVGVSLLAVAALLAGCNKDAAKTEGDGSTADPAVAAGPPTPKRTPGQWEHKITADGQAMAMKICLDEATDQRIAWWGRNVNPDDCSKKEVNRQPDGTWTFYSVCKTTAGGETTASGAATGDFSKAYTVITSLTTTGAQMAQANGTHDIKVDAKWLGPCPAGQRGGDIVGPGGRVINIADLEAMAARGAPSR